jgi:hypothetical protein
VRFAILLIAYLALYIEHIQTEKANDDAREETGRIVPPASSLMGAGVS